MGYLFENMEKMNIQEERKLRADAQKRLEEAEKRFEEEIKLAKEQVAKQVTQQVTEQVAIQSIVESYQELGMSKEITQNKLMEKFKFTESEAKRKLEQYWN